jgi:outer membrane murein-binding lipoprotein Lpp
MDQANVSEDVFRKWKKEVSDAFYRKNHHAVPRFINHLDRSEPFDSNERVTLATFIEEQRQLNNVKMRTEVIREQKEKEMWSTVQEIRSRIEQISSELKELKENSYSNKKQCRSADQTNQSSTEEEKDNDVVSELEVCIIICVGYSY